MFSYGFSPSISVIPTTNTPSVYNFKPIASPSGITFVFGITFTETSPSGIWNKFKFKSTFPTWFVDSEVLLDASIVFSVLYSPIFVFKLSFSFNSIPHKVARFNFSPCINNILFGNNVIFAT